MDRIGTAAVPVIVFLVPSAPMNVADQVSVKLDPGTASGCAVTTADNPSAAFWMSTSVSEDPNEGGAINEVPVTALLFASTGVAKKVSEPPGSRPLIVPVSGILSPCEIMALLGNLRSSARISLSSVTCSPRRCKTFSSNLS